MNPPFPNGDALGALLSLQGLLLAAVGLLMVVMQADQSRRVVPPIFDPMTLLRLVSVGATLAGLGSVAAWVSVFTGGSFVDWTRVVIAGAALAAVLAMLVVTGLLIFARRT